MVAHFQDFWDKKIAVSSDLKIGRFAIKNGSCCCFNIKYLACMNSVLEITMTFAQSD